MKPARAGPRELRSLAGPRGWPLVGNLPGVDLARLHVTLEQWAGRFGPIYVCRFGRRRIVVVAEPELIQQVLRDRPQRFRRVSVLESVLHEVGVDGVFSAEGADWQRQRRIVMQSFNAAQLKRFFPVLVAMAERLRRRWTSAAARGAEVDVLRDFMRYTVDVTTNLAFGHDMNTLEKDDDVMQRHLEHILPMINRRLHAPIRYWRWFKLPADRALDRALAAVRAVIQDLVRRRTQEPAGAAQPASFLEAMLAARDGDAAALSDEELFGNVFTILLAGEDTTAGTMAWIIHFILQHPEVGARLREEAGAAFGSARIAACIEDLDRLPYLEAVANETMRMKPVAPILYLEPNEDSELGGVRIPRGTVVAVLTRAGAVDERFFAAAREFRPERWLANAAGCPAHDTRAFMPFGAGPRFCPGRNLALLEIKMAISMIARSFALSRPAGAPPVGERFAFTMMPTALRVGLSLHT